MPKFRRKPSAPTVEAIQYKMSCHILVRGDWLVEDEEGDQSLVSNTFFHENFEPIE